MAEPSTEPARLAELARAVRESTLKRLERVPEGAEGWRPHPGAMSFADHAQHLLDCDAYLRRVVEEGPAPPEEGGAGLARAGFDALVRGLRESGDARARWIEAMEAAALARRIRDGRFGETTVWWVIARGCLDHETHHRGQIALCLRLLGAASAPPDV